MEYGNAESDGKIYAALHAYSCNPVPFMNRKGFFWKTADTISPLHLTPCDFRLICVQAMLKLFARRG